MERLDRSLDFWMLGKIDQLLEKEYKIEAEYTCIEGFVPKDVISFDYFGHRVEIIETCPWGYVLYVIVDDKEMAVIPEGDDLLDSQILAAQRPSIREIIVGILEKIKAA